MNLKFIKFRVFKSLKKNGLSLRPVNLGTRRKQIWIKLKHETYEISFKCSKFGEKNEKKISFH